MWMKWNGEVSSDYDFGHHLGVRERQTEESGAEFSLESGDTVDVITVFVCEKDITLTWTSNLFGFTLDLVKSWHINASIKYVCPI